MLNRWKVNSIFIVFIGVVVVLTATEAYLIIKVAEGNTSWISGATSLITLLFISAAGKVFLDISRRRFLEGDRLPISSLKELAAEKARVSSNSNQADIAKRVEMIRSILNFLRSRISDWASGTHFEICVFSDKEFPTMVAYTDSALQSRNRSITNREGNPHYYRNERYEAVKLLDNPQSQFYYVNDTRAATFGYKFVREEQRQQIRSSLLVCTDTDCPLVLVVSSNAENAFDLKEMDFDSLIRFVVEMIHEQTSDGKFLEIYRAARPDLFPDVRGV